MDVLSNVSKTALRLPSFRTVLHICSGG